jgi:hypothetical protein
MSEVRLGLGKDGSRHLEVVIDGEVAWTWIPEAPEVLPMPVISALCLNAFALKADAQAAEERLVAAYALLREITVERDDAVRHAHQLETQLFLR